MVDFKDLWQGSTVVCLASGPSVTQEDCEQIQAWRNEGDGKVIVTNSMVFMAPWADAVFAMDSAWWREYYSALKGFAGLRLTSAEGVRGAVRLKLPVTGNSGLASMLAAKHLGASALILVGFDACLGPQGRAHCHPDHPKPLTNARSVTKWKDQHHRAQAHFAGMTVVNASRRSVIATWPKAPLKEALAA